MTPTDTAKQAAEADEMTTYTFADFAEAAKKIGAVAFDDMHHRIWLAVLGRSAVRILQTGTDHAIWRFIGEVHQIPSKDVSFTEATTAALSALAERAAGEGQKSDPQCPNCIEGRMTVNSGGSMWCDRCESSPQPEPPLTTPTTLADMQALAREVDERLLIRIRGRTCISVRFGDVELTLFDPIRSEFDNTGHSNWTTGTFLDACRYAASMLPVEPQEPWDANSNFQWTVNGPRPTIFTTTEPIGTTGTATQSTEADEMMPKRRRKKLHERLLAKVKVSVVNSWNGMSCMEWQGSLKRVGGYGQISVGSKLDGTHRMAKTHRVSWEEFRGPIPAGLHVLHHCDNPLCVNPAHLFLGTHDDNMQDRNEKGRMNPPRGELHVCAKLCDADIPVIRQRLAEGESLLSIASDYGVGGATIFRVGKRECWAHIA